MAINKLYISDQKYNWNNHPSTLLDSHNVGKIIKENTLLDYHASLEDLSFSYIGISCDSANKIIVDASINDNTFTSYGRLLNALLRNKHKVDNIDKLLEDANLEKTNSLVNKRNSEGKIFWTAGCSFTAGVGVSQKERWGTLVSELLALPEISLSRGGSSIRWAADQILRSDIKKDDIVVWGITNNFRVELSENWDFAPWSINDYVTLAKQQYWKMDYFDSETMVLKSIRSILQVMNFCQKIGAKLYLVNLLDITWVSIMLRNYEDFIDLTIDMDIVDTPIYIDYGTDNSHPGPNQHQQYAEKIFNFIKEKHHGKTI